MPIRLTAEILAAAVDGYQARKTRIEAKIAEIRAVLSDGHDNSTAQRKDAPERRKVPAAARRRMALARRARSAEAGRAEPVSKPKAAKPRISKEGMARIIAATKKRWAAVRAAKAEQAKAPGKKTAPLTKAAAKRAAARKTANSPAPEMSATAAQ